MPTPTSITELSQTAGSNWPAGSNAPSVLDDTQRAHASFIAQLRDGKGFTSAVTLSSGATTDIGAQDSFFINVSGTATVTSFGTTYNGPRFIRFTGTPTLTHNATTLICPGAANITTVAGDTCIVVPTGSGWAIASYQRADGTALVSSSVTDYLNSTRIDVASASTVNLTSSAPNTRHINITGTTGITGFTVAIGQCYFVRFAAALTLTNSASLVTQTGADITTAAGDTCIIRATASNTVEIVCYAKVSLFGMTAGSTEPPSVGTGTAGVETTYARSDHTHDGVTTINGQSGAITDTDVDSIGCVMALAHSTSGTTITSGTTYSGSALRKGYTAANGNPFTGLSSLSGTAVSGTWRAMSPASGLNVNADANIYPVALFVRVS